MHQNTSTLRLIKCWDHDNSNLFLEEQSSDTNEGLSIYWRSVNAAVRFWQIAVAKQFEKKSTKDTKVDPNTTPDHKFVKAQSIPKATSRNSRNYRGHHKFYDNYNSQPRHQYFNHYENYEYYDTYNSRYKWDRKDYNNTSSRLPYLSIISLITARCHCAMILAMAQSVLIMSLIKYPDKLPVLVVR